MKIMLLLYVILPLWSCPFTSASSLRSVLGRQQTNTYDFIVVGGGASGLTIADRLSEDPKTSVLVIEYGPFDNREPSVTVPGLLDLEKSPYRWDLNSTPQTHLNGAKFSVPAAHVVGGGTIINGMFFDRGAAADYNAWAQLNGPSYSTWGWDGMLPYFKKSENFTGTAPALANTFDISWDEGVHGHTGSVQSSYPVFAFPSSLNFINAFHSLGISTPKDPGAGIKSGIFWGPSSLDPSGETRSDARAAHYEPVKQRSNYHIKANTMVTKIVITNGRASGVMANDKSSGKQFHWKATKEVVLAAGAVHSPQILELSGIGSGKVLSSLGITPLSDLEGVGENFQDHATLYLGYDYTNGIQPNATELASNMSYATSQLNQYNHNRTGALTITNESGNTVAFLPLQNITTSYQSIISKIDTTDSVSTLYPHLTSTVQAGYTKQHAIIKELYADDTTAVQETGFGTGPGVPVTLVKPLSRGSVHATTNSIKDNPAVDWNTISAPTDLDILVAAVQRNREALRQPAMKALGAFESFPGSNYTTDQQLRDFLPSILTPTYSHPCCTCAMGPKDQGGVVDEALRVHGVTGLSVVDASVFPMIPGAHLSATVYAVAEKAADIIKMRHGMAVHS